MSRSRKKRYIIGVCGGSEKEDKRLANRKFRRIERHSILQDTDCPIKQREISDNWSFTKDGKVYIGGDKNEDFCKKLMRK